MSIVNAILWLQCQERTFWFMSKSEALGLIIWTSSAYQMLGPLQGKHYLWTCSLMHLKVLWNTGVECTSMLYILILRLVFHFESSELAMFMLALPSGIFSELFGFAQLLSSIAHATLNSIYDFQNILGNKDLSLLRRSLKSHYPSNRQSFFSVINFPSFVSNNIRLCWRSTSECTSIGAKEDIGDHIMWNLVQILLRICQLWL